MTKTLKHIAYLAEALDGFRRDAPDSDHQRGYLAALLAVWKEGFGQVLTVEEAGEYLNLLSPGEAPRPIPMVLHCPRCGMQHIDEADPAKDWLNPPHKSHLCHGCGCIWRPADVPTKGVALLATCGSADNWNPGAPAFREALLGLIHGGAK